jgi:hypothetical protein
VKTNQSPPLRLSPPASRLPLLKLVFALAFLTILAATSWASAQMPFWHTPRELVTHPWFIATLVDTYLAFFTFWLWVAYKERSNLARLLWLLLIFALGNLAIAGYMLLQLFRLPRQASIEELLLRRR